MKKVSVIVYLCLNCKIFTSDLYGIDGDAASRCLSCCE